MTRSKMTPVDQARYALAYRTRADLSPEAQAEYDRLKGEGVPVTGSPDPLDERTARTSPEVGARILALFKTTRKCRLPFEKDRLAGCRVVLRHRVDSARLPLVSIGLLRPAHRRVACEAVSRRTASRSCTVRSLTSSLCRATVAWQEA